MTVNCHWQLRKHSTTFAFALNVSTLQPASSGGSLAHV